MGFEKTKKLLENMSNEPNESRTKNCVETTDDGRGTHSKNS